MSFKTRTSFGSNVFPEANTPASIYIGYVWAHAHTHTHTHTHIHTKAPPCFFDGIQGDKEYNSLSQRCHLTPENVAGEKPEIVHFLSIFQHGV